MFALTPIGYYTSSCFGSRIGPRVQAVVSVDSEIAFDAAPAPTTSAVLPLLSQQAPLADPHTLSLLPHRQPEVHARVQSLDGPLDGSHMVLSGSTDHRLTSFTGVVSSETSWFHPEPPATNPVYLLRLAAQLQVAALLGCPVWLL